MKNKTINRNLDKTTLNAICPYFTMFPLEVPYRQLQKAMPNTWVLDPFCGRGTTNYAARLLGLPSVGIDSSPIAVAIAEGKLAKTNPNAVYEVCKEILRSNKNVTWPEGDFWTICFHEETFKNLLKLRESLLKNCKTPERKALRALMLGILHGPKNKGLPSYLSNQMPRTYAAKPDYAVKFWTQRNLYPDYVDVLELVSRKARHFFTEQPPTVDYHMICGDSRELDFSDFGVKFSKVVTSPPYYGMRTYVPDQWLRFWFIGGPSSVTYNHPSQMTHSSPSLFSSQLAGIWRNISKACEADAKMVVRFGGIHDRKANPKEIMVNSFREADCGLKVNTIRSAGLASEGKRQAEQFQRPLRKPIEEFDFYVSFGRK
ncbi:MAG TPA: DNA methyltransferase [Candidatus Rifleibacterium sp.]|nr:DNA methyltransferase [Candidatus Rifleibacterium sp.]